MTVRKSGPKSIKVAFLTVLALGAAVSLTTCDLFKPGFGDKVDVTAPAVAISSPAQNSYVRGTLTVSGTAADDIGITALTVAYPGSSGTITKTVTVTGGAWSIAIPAGDVANAENLPDGERAVTVTARDASGKESTSQLIAFIDNLPPTVLITVPQGYGTSMPITPDYIDIKGEVWDSSPITGATVRLLSSIDKSTLMTNVADGTNTWSTRFDTTLLANDTVYDYIVDVSDKAGNVNTYYYHSQDIWGLMGPGERFPAMDEIGRLDQTKTGAIGSIDYGELFAKILGYSTVVPYSPFANFEKRTDATLPVIRYTNLDPALPITGNVISTRVPIMGFVNRGPANTPIEEGSISAWIIDYSASPVWPPSPNVDAADLTTTGIGTSGSISFQLEPKVGGVYKPSGRYLVRIIAQPQGADPYPLGQYSELIVGFLVDSGAPRIDDIQPADSSLITRKTFTAGPLVGQTGIEIIVTASDDNSVQSVTAVASLESDLTPALPGLAVAEDLPGNPGDYFVQVPLGAGNTAIWFEVEAEDETGAITRRTVQYTIDETDPVIAITSPTAGSWVTGNSTTVSGTSSDAGGVDRIYVWVGPTASTPPADFASWTELAGNASWATTLPLGVEGSYTVHAYVFDFANNQSAEATRTFSLDQSNPTLTETSIGPGAVYRSALFSLGGNAADTNALANITVVQIKDGGAPSTVLNQALAGTSQAWSWNLPGGSTDGTYEYTLTLTDAAGKTAPALSRTVVLDTTPPAVEFASVAPLVGVNTVNGVIAYTVAASDANGLTGVRRWVLLASDPDPVWATGGYTQWASTPYSATLDTTTLTNGQTYEIWVIAQDKAGIDTAVSQVISVDQSSDNPVITLTNMDPANDTPGEAAGNLQESNAKVQGTLTDDDSVDASTIEIAIDTGGYDPVGSVGPDGKTVNFEQTLSSLSEGVHYFSIQAWDLDTAKTPKPSVQNSLGPVYFVIDKNPPALAITSPAQGSLQNGDGGPAVDFTISGTASDANGIPGNIVTIREGAVVIATPAIAAGAWSYNVDVDALSEGAKSWTVEAVDAFSKTTTVPFTFTVDKTAPTVGITTPAAGLWYNGATLSAIGTASDPSGVIAVQWSTNGGTDWYAASGTTNWTVVLDLITLGEGNRTLSIRATDAAGNTSGATNRNFGVDQTAPDTTETAIGTPTASRKVLFNLAGTATDTNALTNLTVEQNKNSTSWVSVYTTALAGTSAAWSVPAASLPRDPAAPGTPLLADGSYEYRITVTDVAGNTKIVTRTVTVDLTPPTALITDPTADAIMVGTAYSVSGTAADTGGSGVGTVYWWAGNFGAAPPAFPGSWNTATGTTNWNALLNLTALGEGRRTLYVRAVDGAANEMAAAVTVNFYIDQAPPTLAITGPANGSVYSAGFTMSGTASDVNLSTVRVQINSDGWNPATGTASWTYAVAIGSLSVGTNTITVEAADIAGRTTTDSIEVFRDQAAPVIAFNNLAGDGSSVLMESSPVLYGSVTDASGVVSAESYIESWNYGTSSWNAAPVEGWTTLGATGNAKVYSWQKDIGSTGLNLPEGRYRVTIRSSDIAAPTANATSGVPGTVGESVAFRVDRVNPALALTVPAQGSFQRVDFPVTGTSSDANTISSVRVKVDSSDFGSGYVNATSGDGFATWSATVSTGSLAAGPHTIYVQATDGATRTTMLSRDFTFDNAAPTVNVITPLSGITVNGAVTVKGTSSDTNAVSLVELKIGKDTIWNTLPGVYSWEYPFINIDAYANSTFADETFPSSGVWRLYIYIRAWDTANNSYTLDTYYLDLDPAMDTPITTIYQPLDNQTVGGSTRVYGIATDDDAVFRVEMQIDLNNDNDFADESDYWNYSGVGIPTLAADGDTNDRFEKEATWYTVTGTTNWYQIINQFGEYNAPIPGDTRTLRIRVRAVDTKDGLNPGIAGNYQQILIVIDNTVPIIEDVQIDLDADRDNLNGIPYSTGIRVAGTFWIDAIIKDNVDVEQIDRVEQGPLSGTDRIDDDGYPVIEDLGIASGYHSYRVRLEIDTLNDFGGIFTDTSGTYAVSLKATDGTSPNPYVTFSYLNIQVDNYYPAGAYTGNLAQVVGTNYKIQGTGTDVGAGSGTVQGVDRIVGYFVKDGTPNDLVYDLQTAGPGNSTPLTTTKTLKNSVSGDLESMPYPDSATYRISIDRLTEVGVSDDLPNGDEDGYLESLTISGNTYDWWAEVDTTNVPDGTIEFHYVVFDKAGNGTHYVQSLFVRNNTPIIDSIVLATDINGDSDATDPGESATFTAGYGATNFTVRNNRLIITVNASSGNGALHYSMMYGGNERNGTLTNSRTITDFVSAPAMPDTVVNGAVFSITVFDSTNGDDDVPAGDLTQAGAPLFLGMTLDNVDDTPPTVTVAPFGEKYDLPDPNRDADKALMNVGDYNENIVMSGSVRTGHVEYAADSRYNGTDGDPDVSGRVILKGKAWDNQRIQTITAQIPGYNGGAGAGAAFNVATWNGSGLSALSSATPYWVFSINAGSEAVTEANGHVLNWSFEWDSAALTAVADEDVVITFTIDDFGTAPDQTGTLTMDVVPYITQIANTTGGLSADVIRSSTGKYSLDYNATGSITVTGFNLSGASARVSPASITTPSGTVLTVTGTTATTATITRDFLRSGYLTLFVNSVPSTNNLNDPDALSGTTYYNREKDVTKVISEKWTDDRYIWMWRDTQVLPTINTQTFYYPDMIMDTDQPLFTYANDNNGYTYRTTGDTAGGGNPFAKAGIWYERQTAVAFADGYYWILSVEDAFSAGNIGFLQLNRDANAAAAVGTADTDFIEIIGEDYNSRQLNRFRYPKLIAQTSTTNDADIYVAYYDAHPSERGLTFLSFRATGANASNLTQAVGDATRATQVLVLPGTAGGNCSQYYDMVKVNTTDIAVVYFDETAGTLKMQYSSNAWDVNNLTNTGATWTEQTVDASPLTGGHVSATSDGTYLYVAYYDAGEANLKFSRITWATKAVQTYVIDSYLSVGTWTQVQVFNGVPYITYYSDSYNGTRKPVRIAFPTDGNGGVSAANTTTHGVLDSGASEAYSGTWEVMTVPTVTVPKGGMEQFNHTQLGTYTNNGQTLPVVGWLGDRIEYGKLQPNN